MLNKFRLLSLLIPLIISFYAVSSVSAHRPDMGNSGSQITIDNLQTSFAFYRSLSELSPVDIYTFTAQVGDHLHAGISIPAIANLNHYGVNVGVTGPGLPPVNHGDLPIGLAAGDGALIFHSKPGQDFFEPFTQTNYWGRQRIELNLARAGTYHLVVWAQDGQPGKYVLDTGQAEVFGPADLLRFPVWWVQVHTYFGQDFTFGIVLAILVAIALLVGLNLVRRKARATG